VLLQKNIKNQIYQKINFISVDEKLDLLFLYHKIKKKWKESWTSLFSFCSFVVTKCAILKRAAVNHKLSKSL